LFHILILVQIYEFSTDKEVFSYAEIKKKVIEGAICGFFYIFAEQNM